MPGDKRLFSHRFRSAVLLGRDDIAIYLPDPVEVREWLLGTGPR